MASVQFYYATNTDLIRHYGRTYKTQAGALRAAHRWVERDQDRVAVVDSDDNTTQVLEHTTKDGER